MGFIASQFKTLPYPTGNYVGQTIVITGSNVGLGKEAARHFIRMGAARIILAVRNVEKGQEAKAELENTPIEVGTGNKKCVLDVWEVDMASYASVERFSDRVTRDLDRIDIFLANAGIAPGSYRTAEDNEASITVNFTATMLLAALIMPKLKAVAREHKIRPTLSIVSSDVHHHTTVPQKSAPEGGIIAAINDKESAEKNWDEQYPLSKILGVFAVRALAERHPASSIPVTINLINPGLCHSELGRDIPTWGFWLIKLVLARTTEVGSRTLVHGSSQGVESHGQYMSDCTTGAPAPFVVSEEGKKVQERVYSEMVTKLEAIKPGCMSNF